MPRASRIGARIVGGQMTAMSSVGLFAPEPVLSPTRPSFGTATRNRLSPVLVGAEPTYQLLARRVTDQRDQSEGILLDPPR